MEEGGGRIRRTEKIFLNSFFSFNSCSIGKGSLAGAQKHGLMSRRSKRKNWKPAYFVLRDKNIYIFKSEDDAVRF